MAAPCDCVLCVRNRNVSTRLLACIKHGWFSCSGRFVIQCRRGRLTCAHFTILHPPQQLACASRHRGRAATPFRARPRATTETRILGAAPRQVPGAAPYTSTTRPGSGAEKKPTCPALAPQRNGCVRATRGIPLGWLLAQVGLGYRTAAPRGGSRGGPAARRGCRSD